MSTTAAPNNREEFGTSIAQKRQCSNCHFCKPGLGFRLECHIDKMVFDGPKAFPTRADWTCPMFTANPAKVTK